MMRRIIVSIPSDGLSTCFRVVPDHSLLLAKKGGLEGDSSRWSNRRNWFRNSSNGRQVSVKLTYNPPHRTIAPGSQPSRKGFDQHEGRSSLEKKFMFYLEVLDTHRFTLALFENHRNIDSTTNSSKFCLQGGNPVYFDTTAQLFCSSVLMARNIHGSVDLVKDSLTVLYFPSPIRKVVYYFKHK